MNDLFLDQQKCINFRYKKTNCNSCKDSCPCGCFEGSGETQPANCNACGCCISACPVDAIAVEGFSEDAWRKLLGRPDEMVDFTCQVLDPKSPWPCLGFLDARDLLGFALETPVFRTINLHIGRCRDCRPYVAARLEKSINAVSVFLLRAGRAKINQVDFTGVKAESANTVDRRAFFMHFFQSGAEAIRKGIWPEEGKKPLSKRAACAAILGDEEKEILELNQDIFPSLSIKQTCVACGNCARLCASRAMTSIDRVTFLELYHQPALCSGCGICIAHCPVGAIDTLQAGTLKKHKLIVIDFPHCLECGQIFQPAGSQGICFECMIKAKESIIK